MEFKRGANKEVRPSITALHMAKITFRSCLFTIFLSVCTSIGLYAKVGDDPVAVVLSQLERETKLLHQSCLQKITTKESRKCKIDSSLKQAGSVSGKVALLIERQSIVDELIQMKLDTEHEVAKIRYLKGLQIIKILYEKVLGLDHHFAGVRTLAEINKISNPNQYPEFAKFRELVISKSDKKASFSVSNLLGTNPLVSVIQTFTNLVGSKMDKKEREIELQKVECILDFTLRMQHDLNTIYFETSFLQSSNEKMKADIETLFRDYAKPIAYYETLEACRINDDWETVAQKMEDYLVNMKKTSGNAQVKMLVNIEFPIDRLMQFINQYNNFIDQGGKFYEKFQIILSSYENEKQCETKLPAEYQKLKADTDLAVNKFNVAYKPIEINGSKMKAVLYGVNEFD